MTADPIEECISDPDIPNGGEEIIGLNLPYNADIREQLADIRS